MAETELEEFEIYSDESSITPTPKNEGTNASRFAIVGALSTQLVDTFGERSPLVDREALERFGFDSDSVLNSRFRYFDFTGSAYEEAATFIQRRSLWTNGEVRFQAWNALAYEGNLQARLMLLSAGLSSILERESVAAAVAIVGVLRDSGVTEDLRLMAARTGTREWMRPWAEEWPWTWIDAPEPPSEDADENAERPAGPWLGEQWNQFAETIIDRALRLGDVRVLLASLLWIGRIRIRNATRSSDTVARELAFSARWTPSDDTPEDTIAPATVQATQPSTATMLHGTWGWKGDWWYPNGDFHSYVKRKLRPRTYSDGMEFSWSGAYSQQQRATAGERFLRWVRSYSPVDGIGTVFAHSYGGEVAARAINAGAKVHELVLLSAPVNAHHQAAIDRVSRVIDVRLKFDIVLYLARERQSLPPHPNVTPCVVDKAFWSHGATHSPRFWENEGVIGQVGL